MSRLIASSPPETVKPPGERRRRHRRPERCPWTMAFPTRSLATLRFIRPVLMDWCSRRPIVARRICTSATAAHGGCDGSDTRRTAGLSNEITLHDLRHFYASLLIRHGTSVKTVQARLGHKSATETLIHTPTFGPTPTSRPATFSTARSADCERETECSAYWSRLSRAAYLMLLSSPQLAGWGLFSYSEPR